MDKRYSHLGKACSNEDSDDGKGFRPLQPGTKTTWIRTEPSFLIGAHGGLIWRSWLGRLRNGVRPQLFAFSPAGRSGLSWNSGHRHWSSLHKNNWLMAERKVKSYNPRSHWEIRACEIFSFVLVTVFDPPVCKDQRHGCLDSLKRQRELTSKIQATIS